MIASASQALNTFKMPILIADKKLDFWFLAKSGLAMQYVCFLYFLFNIHTIRAI